MITEPGAHIPTAKVPAAGAPVPDAGLLADIDRRARVFAQAGRTNIGFPGATDFDYSPLAPLLCTQLINNVGDPYVDGVAANHTKDLEREVVGFCADLLRAPDDDRWGYVTSGGTEGNLYALYLARTLHPTGIVYHSDAAHDSIGKALRLLGMDSVRIRTDEWDSLDYLDLAGQIALRRHQPAIVVATAGTTMHEAVDDVRRTTHILDKLAVRDRFVHVDAALSGIPLALLDPDVRPGLDFADGADSVTVSAHKYFGSPAPAGIVVTRASYRDRVARSTGYTGSPDATIGGSRSGHAPLILWYAINLHGISGLRARADAARELAAYAHQRLADLGWPAHRHPLAFTVALATPPARVLNKWVLVSHGDWSHLVTIPGVSTQVIDRFIQDLAAAMPTPRVPRQRLAPDVEGAP
jgi:histidine decarboxylase